jgi:hypothetical protein
VQGAPAGGGSSGLDALGDNIKKAAITDKSPAGALAKVRSPCCTVWPALTGV